MSKQCQNCKQVNADWAEKCGRCGKPLFKPIDLEDEFDDFMRKVNPTVQPHSVQYHESRRVWFAACAALFQQMAFNVPEVSDDEGVKEFENINAQLHEFKKRVAEHRD